MQIYITKASQDFKVSDVVQAHFNGEKLSVFFGDSLVYLSNASIGQSYYISRKKNKFLIEKVSIPEDMAGKLAWILSFDEKKRCVSMEDFIKRCEVVKENYPSKRFIIGSKDNAYAFLVAKKQDRRFFTPLLIWVNQDISASEIQELFDDYRDYRKIYEPKDFIEILLKAN